MALLLWILEPAFGIKSPWLREGLRICGVEKKSIKENSTSHFFSFLGARGNQHERFVGRVNIRTAIAAPSV